MSIRIIGGTAKGFSLRVPSESITRPTSVLLKRRLFDYYQNLNGFYFIDLCAGSGSVGFEALSRGASAVLLIEKSNKAFKILSTNLDNFKNKFPELKNDINLEKIDFCFWFKKFKTFYHQLKDEEKKKIILFFDPPYENIMLYKKFFKEVHDISYIGIVVVEACCQKTMTGEEFILEFGKPSRNYRQGTSFLYLYDYN